MATIEICDATGRKLEPGEGELTTWGFQRIYAPEVIESVDEYTTELMAAANFARMVFEEKREALRAKWHEVYPDGLLPDEPIPTAEPPLPVVERVPDEET